jgi:SanA protein
MNFPRLRTIAKVTSLTIVAGVVAVIALNMWVLIDSRDEIYADAQSAPDRTVAIVLGARVWSSGEPSRPLADRLATALELWENGTVNKILVSGDHSKNDYDEVNAMREWLVTRGVPDDVIYTDHAGLRTHDSMVRAASIFHVDSAIICTQRFHLYRSVYLARRAGIDAVGVPADRSVYVSRNWDALREAFARPIAVFDALIDRPPAHLGPAVPVTGPASASRG